MRAAGPAGARAWWLGACVAVVAAAGFASARVPLGGDYANEVCDTWGCDDPARALSALIDGRFGDFFSQQPIMGLFSVLLRAPAVAVVDALGGTTLDEYRAGAFVCAALAGLIGVWLAREAWRRGASALTAAAMLVVIVVATLWTNALVLGHPEEPVAAALALAAIVCAASGRPLAAGVLLGAAIGTKEWALLAGLPVLVAAGLADWRHVAIPAAVVAAALVLPFAIGDPGAFQDAHAARTRPNHSGTPANIWWQFGTERVLGESDGVRRSQIYPPDAAGRFARPAVFLIALMAAFAFWRRRGQAFALEVLGLVAFIFLLRVVLDTETYSYHHVPMLMAIAAWEAISRRRFPIVAVAATVAMQLTQRWIATDLSPDTFNALYLAWALPLTAYLGVAALRRTTSAGPA